MPPREMASWGPPGDTDLRKSPSYNVNNSSWAGVVSPRRKGRIQQTVLSRQRPEGQGVEDVVVDDSPVFRT